MKEIIPLNTMGDYARVLTTLWETLDRDWYPSCSGIYPADHGRRHINSVLAHLSIFVRQIPPTLFAPGTCDWESARQQVFHLWVGTLIHDLGMRYVGQASKDGDAIHRKRHAHSEVIKECCEMSTVAKLLEPDDLDQARHIAWAHAGDNEVTASDKLSQIEVIATTRPSYSHLPLCCRLLRFADALDIGEHRRIPVGPGFTRRRDQDVHDELHRTMQVSIAHNRIAFQPRSDVFATPVSLSDDLICLIDAIRTDLRAQRSGLSNVLVNWDFHAPDITTSTITSSTQLASKRAVPEAFGYRGVVEFIPKRSDLTSEWWENYFFAAAKRPNHVALMSQTMLPVFANEKQCKSIVEWCNASGTHVRLLLLSQSPREYSQVISVGQSIESDLVNRDFLRNVPDNIDQTLQHILKRITPLIANPHCRPAIRFAHCAIPYCINCIDDDMYVTFYGTQSEGNDQPTLHIQGRDSDAFKAFMREYDIIWRTKSSVQPTEDPVLLQYRNHWPRFLTLRSILNNKLPAAARLDPPEQAIIFPTWKCRSGKCSFCMFSRGQYPVQEMSLSLFERVIDELVAYGTRTFEISGGGEPLEHSRIDDIIKVISRCRLRHPGTRFGLLTNGLRLPADVVPLLEAFDKYIRFSFCESLTDRNDNSGSLCYTKHFDRWKRNLRRLIEAKRNHPSCESHIGVKLLVTRTNAAHFADIARDLLLDKQLRGVTHWRFRSSRDVAESEIPRIEQEVYSFVLESGLTRESVSVALPPTQYPAHFKCWTSPVQTTIIPDGSVYICCNFEHNPERCIGNIESGFATVWNGNRHELARRTLDGAKCRNACYANCRFAELQALLDPIAAHLGQDAV